MGLSCVELISVEREKENGYVLIVGGADLLDGTPIYDIKPYLPYSDSKPEAKGGYADEEANHRLDVVIDDELLEKIAQEKRQPILECLADDPRPSYQEDEKRIYKMSFAEYEIEFTVDENLLTVVGVSIR